jgi:hypothetical protein
MSFAQSLASFGRPADAGGGRVKHCSNTLRDRASPTLSLNRNIISRGRDIPNVTGGGE